ncbi:hypothetical protein RIR_jg33915.t1 [Rhizophagus irregularis DAOM 181602=DAOM 197198]|nr:hypothetical protein RIR_jg33915.t1 [Rhizophagus irregularis DAOM 181602=DAOM 197198]
MEILRGIINLLNGRKGFWTLALLVSGVCIISGHAGKFDERLLISKHWNHKIWLNLDSESWVLASYF